MRVTPEATPEPAPKERRRLLSRHRRDILKGVRSYIGNCYEMKVSIQHFSAATGPCSFLGTFSVDPVSGRPDWNSLSFFHASYPRPELDRYYEGDEISLDAVYAGVTTYQSEGGFRNALEFMIERTIRQ